MKFSKIFKPVSTLLLATILLLFVCTIACASTPFTDLEDSWAAADIDSLYQKDIYQGMIFEDSSAFKPEQPITRAEFLLMLFNAMGLDLQARDTAQTTPFKDYMDMPTAYQPFITEGYRRGIMLGRVDADGALLSGWDSTLTRQEAVTFVGRILNARSEDNLTFTDSATVASWARDYLAAQADKGIFQGMTDGSFAPQRNFSRAQASRVINTLMQQKLFIPTEIRVYAGSTELGITNGARLTASFGMPYGLITAKDGSMLVADKEANLLRRITQQNVNLLAGQVKDLDLNGLPSRGYRDNTASTDIMLRGPRYLAQASNGNIYYSDGGNNAVRMITTDGRGFTVSGNGKAGYVNGVREKSEFNLPSGLDFDAKGTLYVADTLNNCIRTIDAKGATAIFAGTPGENGGYKDGDLTAAQFCQPTDIQFGPDGSLYVADTGNSLIRVIRDGQVSTFAGKATAREELSGAMLGGYADGAAAESLFRGPLGIFVSRGGAVFVADTENNLIRKIEGGYVTTVAGNMKAGNSTGPALVSMLNSPIDVLVVDNAIYVSDGNNHCIKVFGAGLGE